MKRRSDVSVELLGRQFLDDEAKSDNENDSDSVSSVVEDSGNLNFYQKLQLINLPINNFEIYLGNKQSVRYFCEDEILNSFKLLSTFKNKDEISIDGPSGVGKTSLMEKLNRKYCKVNLSNKIITDGPKYNISPMRSLMYRYTFLYSKGKNVCWDRCVYSNMIFQIVSFLCAFYENVPESYIHVYPVIDWFVNSVHLKSTIKMCMIEKDIPILFLVNSNIKQIIQNLISRGEAKDFYLSTNLNYQYAQLHVYTYFAKLTKNPLIDIGKCSLPRNELNEKIINLIDCYDENDQYMNYYEFSDSLFKFDDEDKSFLYTNSKK